MKVISGCLQSLKGSGLVRELAGSRYQRINVKHDKPALADLPAMLEAIDEEPPRVGVPAAVRLDPLNRLASVAAKVRSLADGYNELAQEIEDVALEVEAQKERNGAENARLNQLRSLLRDFAGEAP